MYNLKFNKFSEWQKITQLFRLKTLVHKLFFFFASLLPKNIMIQYKICAKNVNVCCENYFKRLYSAISSWFVRCVFSVRIRFIFLFVWCGGIQWNMMRISFDRVIYLMKYYELGIFIWFGLVCSLGWHRNGSLFHWAKIIEINVSSLALCIILWNDMKISAQQTDNVYFVYTQRVFRFFFCLCSECSYICL